MYGFASMDMIEFYPQGYLTATSYGGQKKTMTKTFRIARKGRRMDELLKRRQRAFRLTILEKAKVTGLLLFGTPVVVTIVAYLWKVAFHAVLG